MNLWISGEVEIVNNTLGFKLYESSDIQPAYIAVLSLFHLHKAVAISCWQSLVGIVSTCALHIAVLFFLLLTSASGNLLLAECHS